MKAFTYGGTGFSVAALCLTMAVAAGQTTTTPGGPTCPTVPASLTSFSIENTVKLTNFLATTTPNIPANIIAAITGGAQEIRERLIYNPGGNTITATVFLVAPGSPSPTPLSSNITSTTLATYAISIDKIYQSCTPTPAIMFVGTVTSSSGGALVSAGPFGSLVGDPAAISVGYTNASPPVLSNVVTLFSGIGVSYSAAGSGTVTFPVVAVTPPGSNGSGPTIVLNPNFSSTGVNQVNQNFLTLDASGTQGATKFAWSANPPVTFIPNSADAAVEQVQLPSKGDYVFTLTVTGNGGTTSTLTFTIGYR